MSIVTLTTDFGTRDGFVGAVKGVILRIAPQATIIDIAHEIPRGDIAHAAWVIATSAREFPSGTIHVVVVDPGVGGARQGVIGLSAPDEWMSKATAEREQIYVGPDNGVFGYLVMAKTYLIDTSGFGHAISSTFHGRDVFARVAGQLASGERRAKSFGPKTQLKGALPWGKRIRGSGRVVHIDHYGNLISDLPAAEVEHGAVVVANRRLALSPTYEAVGRGELLAYVGSAGTIEVAVRDGRADTTLELERGASIDPAPQTSNGPYR